MSQSQEPSEKQRDMAAIWLAKRTGGHFSTSDLNELEEWLNADRLNRLAWDEMRVLWAHLEEPSKRVIRLAPPSTSVARHLTRSRNWIGFAGAGIAATLAVLIIDPNFIQNFQADIVSGRHYVTSQTLPDGTVVKMGQILLFHLRLTIAKGTYGCCAVRHFLKSLRVQHLTSRLISMET